LRTSQICRAHGQVRLQSSSCRALQRSKHSHAAADLLGSARMDKSTSFGV